MAESFSVKAILSAADRGFTSTMKSASSYVNNLKSTLTSGIGFGVMMAAGQKAFDVVSNGVTGLISDMNDASAAWKTFQGNMKMNGHTADEIRSIKSELQDFAEATIYSSSDMASTFAQLEAVGTKNTTKLVKGFGGLAAAAESPTQAMKTLSQQATQMAAKPTVAWEDFKLMLEQTPAGIAAVSKQMGMSTQDMIKNVQDGKIATEDFFEAIATVGTNDSFTKLATQYKTVGQAMDGLTETAANKLQPAFDVLSEKGISAISKLVDKVGELDGEKIAAKLTSGLDKIKPYWDTIVGVAAEVGSAFGDAFSAISEELAELNGSFGSTESVESFGDAIGVAGDVLKTFAGFLEDHADTVALLINNLPKLVAAYMAFKVVKAVAPGLLSFGSATVTLAKSGISKLAGKLFGTAKGTEAVGKSSATSSKKVLTSAKAFMMLGAGVALISGSFYVLAKAAQELADAGGPAIAIFSGMALAVTGLALGLTYMLANIKSTPKRMEALGNSFLKASAGIAIITLSLAALALALVPLGELGSTAVPALAAFGVVVAGLAVTFGVFGKSLSTNMAGVIAFSASISVLALAMTPIASTGTEGAIAMAAFGVVVAGLVAVMGLFGGALNAAIPGMLAFGATLLMVGEGMNLASSFIDSLVPLIEQLGETFQVVGQTIGDVAISIGEAFTLVSDGVATVVDAIAGGFSDVLNSIANIIESVGTSAKNAGLGFQYVATGIERISGLSLWDIGKSLTAVATGIGTISTSGKNLPEVAAGMQLLLAALMMASSSVTVFVAGMQQVATTSAVASASLQTAQAAFSGFVIVAPDVSPMLAAFTAIAAAAMALVPQLNSAGQQAGQGLAKGMTSGSKAAEAATKTAVHSITSETQRLVPQMGTAGEQAANQFSRALQSGYNRAVAYSRSASSSILSALRGAQSGAYSCGYNIGAGLANGMAASLGRVRSIATQLAAEAEKAIRAKAKIHSPSRVSGKLGSYWAQGWINHILDKVRESRKAIKELIYIPPLPDIPTPSMAGAGGGSWDLKDEYEYSRNAKYTIVVPVEIDGKETARVTAPYTEAELDKRQKINNMINGKR